MHTFPLSLARYRRFFAEGAALAVAGHHAALPDDLAPPHVKHRSRLHWWRAEQIVRRRTDVPPGALALSVVPDPSLQRKRRREEALAYAAGSDALITETAIGNVLAVRVGTVCTPPRGTVLDGISLRVVEGLCAGLGLPFREQPLSLAEAQSASEVMLTGTAFCLAGVRWLEGVELPHPGPITRRLLEAWSAEVGLDVAGAFLAAR
jgi:branched-chain amino acid aminotransferase